MAMYEVGTVMGAASQARVTGATTKWSQEALGILPGSILVVYRSGSADLYAIKSVDSDTQLTLTRNITTAFSGASYGIITAETASTSSFANQLASAFAFWRSVVEGWSMALTGSGNITLTDPITGKQVIVPAIAGMAKASDLNALAKLTGGNKLDGSQVITSDNAGFILGMNSDLALLKKQGQGGTIAVGSGTPFRVQRSRATTVSPADTFDDILVIDANNQTTLPGALSAGGNIDNTSKGKVLTQAIELSFSTPYIDFHFNYSTDDFTGRIIATAADQISVQGSHWRVDRDLRVGGAASIGGWTQCLDDLSANKTDFGSPAIGALVSGGRIRSRMLGRGGNVDPSGAWGGFYVEEYVGTEHRIVMYMDGFGRTDAWSFRAGGTISTPKGDVLTTGSDVRLKTDFTQASENASERIERLGVCEYRMKGETRRRRGFIAQQAEKVDPIYTFQSGDVEIDGEKINILNVDHTAIIADLVLTVQELTKQVRDLNKQVQTTDVHSVTSEGCPFT
ncbi:tail fiber domain-containing protein [Klebsiella pneumoniae]